MPPKRKLNPAMKKFMARKKKALKNNEKNFKYTNSEGKTITYERFKMNKSLYSYRRK